jgi:hypothetical protein
MRLASPTSQQPLRDGGVFRTHTDRATKACEKAGIGEENELRAFIIVGLILIILAGCYGLARVYIWATNKGDG